MAFTFSWTHIKTSGHGSAAARVLLCGRSTPAHSIQKRSPLLKRHLYITPTLIPLATQRCCGVRITIDLRVKLFSLFSLLVKTSLPMRSLTERTFKTFCKNTTSQRVSTLLSEYTRLVT